MLESKIAITKTVGNNEIILKFFSQDEKEAAKAYGAAVAKDNVDGVISCVLAEFDESGKMEDNQCQVLEVWG